MDPQLVDIAKFRKRCDPTIDNPWPPSDPVTQCRIQKAIDDNYLIHPSSEDCRFNHASRIAWFVVHGWDDPIEIDVGVPTLGCNPSWPLEDGNHRFTAAIMKGDDSISANISGAIDEIQSILYKKEEIL